MQATPERDRISRSPTAGRNSVDHGLHYWAIIKERERLKRALYGWGSCVVSRPEVRLSLRQWRLTRYSRENKGCSSLQSSPLRCLAVFRSRKKGETGFGHSHVLGHFECIS